MKCRERRSIALVVFSSLLLLSTSPFVASQQGQSQQAKPEQPVFRSGVELVEIDTVAVDAAGRPVTDLRKEEFQVFEDGKQRTIESFALVNLPSAAARAAGP